MPEPVIATPPPAPAAAPAPAAPAPAPAAPPTVLETPGTEHPNPYAEIEAVIKKVDAKPEQTTGKPTAGTPPTAPPKTPGAKPGDDKPPVIPKSVRDQWESERNRLKSELQTIQSAKAELEAKISSYEAKGKDTEVLTEKLTKMEKAIAERDAEIRALKHEKSPDFIKKHDEPFQRAAAQARKVIEKIQVLDPTTGNSRPGSWTDFSRIYQLDPYSALQEFRAAFGEDGAIIARDFYNDLHKMDDAREAALKEEKEQAASRQAEEEAKQIQTREQVNTIWKKVNQDLSEKVDDYHDSPDDKELVELRQKALAIYDRPSKTFQEKIIKDAHNRQRVAAFPVLKLKLSRVTQERDELRAELDGVKPRPPKPTKSAGGAPTAQPEDDFETGLRKHMAGV